MTEKVISYIRKQLDDDKSVSEIKKELIKTGYSEEEAKGYLQEALGGPNEESKGNFATLVQRLVVLLDHLLVSIVISILSFSVLPLFFAEPSAIDVSIFVVIGNLLYFTILEAKDGQTLAKKVSKVKVVRSDGTPVGLGRSLLRNIFRFIDALLFYAIGAGLIMYTEKSQRLGDLVADTIVIQADSNGVPKAKDSNNNKTAGVIVLIFAILFVLIMLPAFFISLGPIGGTCPTSDPVFTNESFMIRSVAFLDNSTIRLGVQAISENVNITDVNVGTVNNSGKSYKLIRANGKDLLKINLDEVRESGSCFNSKLLITYNGGVKAEGVKNMTYPVP